MIGKGGSRCAGASTTIVMVFTIPIVLLSNVCHPLCSMGAPVMVELEGETDPLKIAMKELK